MNLQNILDTHEKELNGFLIQNDFLHNEVIALEKNENSFLVLFCKESTIEFFEKIFSAEGSYWRAYFDLSLAEKPLGKKYAFFFANQLFFCKNIEDKYTYSINSKKKWVIGKKGPEYKKTFSLDRAIRLIAAPINTVTQAKKNIVNAFKINELFLGFDKEIADSKESLKSANNNSVTYLQAQEYLQKAEGAMYYSFLASLGSYLRLKPGRELKRIIEETRYFFENQSDPKKSGGNEFLSENFYDISVIRNGESGDPVQKISPPVQDWMVLREAAKLAAARHLYAQRKAYLHAKEKLGLNENVFFLRSNELTSGETDLIQSAVEQRSREFMENKNYLLPQRFFYSQKWFFEQDWQSTPAPESAKTYTIEKTGDENKTPAQEISKPKEKTAQEEENPQNTELSKISNKNFAGEEENETNELNNYNSAQNLANKEKSQNIKAEDFITAQNFAAEGQSETKELNKFEKEINLEGISAGSKLTVQGPAAWIHNETDLSKDFNGKIILTDYFPPNIVVAYNGVLGVVSSVGGALSHPAVVAREKNIPCVLQVNGLSQINEGTKIELDGEKGKIKIIPAK